MGVQRFILFGLHPLLIQSRVEERFMGFLLADMDQIGLGSMDATYGIWDLSRKLST